MTGTANAGVGRRRSPQAVPRPRLVKFFLTDDELAELDEAAGQAGLARNAFAAEVTMAAARGQSARISTPLREAPGGTDVRSRAGAPGRNKPQSGSCPIKCHRATR